MNDFGDSMFKKINLMLIIIVLILLLTISFSYAQEDLDSLRDAINNNSGTDYLTGEGKKDLMEFIRDTFNIVRIIVGTLMLIQMFNLFIDFKLASESPAVKSLIKIKVKWLVVGFVFLINFWNIFDFFSKPFF